MSLAACIKQSVVSVNSHSVVDIYNIMGLFLLMFTKMALRYKITKLKWCSQPGRCVSVVFIFSAWHELHLFLAQVDVFVLSVIKKIIIILKVVWKNDGLWVMQACFIMKKVIPMQDFHHTIVLIIRTCSHSYNGVIIAYVGAINMPIIVFRVLWFYFSYLSTFM